jgi:3-hydroxyisobutyrate dehydrogenase-like beta-hydroxyacid dehydrogenase
VTCVGVLHPGAMGSSVGAAARAGGAEVYWCEAGRSEETRRRAREDRLSAVQSLRELVDACEVIVSVCPPHAALEVASEIARLGFRGLYADVNAVSRTTAQQIGAAVTQSGAAFVDGGIMGPPARPGRTTLLCLSGERAPEVARLFEGTPLQASIVGPLPGQASALKMAFAAWSKGSAALLIAVRALAEAEGVTGALLDSWARLAPDLAQRSEQAALGAAPKAWRWSGEMREIAQSFGAVGLPSDFHEGAAKLYEKLDEFKTTEASLAAVVAALLR